jgi:DNA-binding transcriptional LysR family regulator
MFEALTTFVNVAATGSFSRIARQEDVAVSSITRRIDWLESELGAKLFSRSSRLLVLTDAGERFLPRARSLLADLSEAKDELVSLNAEPRGPLTVTAPSVFGRRWVSPAAIDFLAQYPLLELDLHLSDEVVDLRVRRVDVAIRIGSLPDSDLIATRIAPLRRLVCASPAYLERRGRPVAPGDLLQHDCLTAASAPAPPDWWRFDGVNRNRALPVRGTLRTDDTDTLLQAAVAGVGIVHLASWLVTEMIAAGRLVVLFPNAQPPKGAVPAIHAVRMSGRSHTGKATLFIAHLRKAFGDPPLWERGLGMAQRPAPGRQRQDVSRSTRKRQRKM